MRILALETATLAGSVALLEGGRVSAETSLDIALTHSERLMAMVDRLLAGLRAGHRAAWMGSRCPSARARSPGSAWASRPRRGSR